MKITLEADYAIRIVYSLMRSGTTTSARKISEQSGVTLRFALKILRKLAQGGIVQSTKGAAGGYRLALPPSELPLGQIVECIDGSLDISHCLSSDFDCTRVGDKRLCQFRRTLVDISAKLREEFYAVKMSDYMS